MWDANGISGLKSGPYTMAVFLNGEFHRGASAVDGEFKPPDPEDNEILSLMVPMDSFRQGEVHFDEIKVWSYAKTDFTDAFPPVSTQE